MRRISSDVLEAQFGPTELEVLRQDRTHRFIRTLSVASGQVLEVSWVQFSTEGAAAYPEAHERVVTGASMGKVFRGAGVEFRRAETFSGRMPAPYFTLHHFKDESRPPLVKEVDVAVGSDSTAYASILELYTPALQWEEPEASSSAHPEGEVALRIDAFAAMLLQVG